MEKALIQYLSQHNELHLGKLGTFRVHDHNASVEPINNIAFAPYKTILLSDNKSAQIDREFVDYVAASNDYSEKEARSKTQTFVSEILNELAESGQREIHGLGLLLKKEDALVFHANSDFSLPAVPALKVIRQNAVHALRVGDKEVSNEEMIAYYENQNASNPVWMYWTAGVLAAVLIVLAAMYYL